MIKSILILITFILIICLTIMCRKEPYDVNITQRGLRLDPLFVSVPKDPNMYKGYVDYPRSELLDLCPSVEKKKNNQTISCKTRLDCGPAEVCINDGVSSYCQCSISNDCIASGVC